MLDEKNKMLERIQHLKPIKVPFIMYEDLESQIKK